MLYCDKYGRRWSGPFRFTVEEITAHAPPEFGLYQVLYSGGDAMLVLYIGIATGSKIRDRLQKHRTGKGNSFLRMVEQLYADTDPHFVDRLYFVYHCCDKDSAKQIESHVVSTEKPPFNIRNEYKHFIPSIFLH